VRRWRVLDAAMAKGVAENPDVLASPVGAPALRWTGAYSLVSGELPADALATAPGSNVAFARCEIDVTAPGKVGLHLDSISGLKLWVDGQPVPIKTDVELEMPRGVHGLVFQVEKASRGKDGLRLELRDVPGSSGAAQPVGGA